MSVSIAEGTSNRPSYTRESLASRWQVCKHTIALWEKQGKLKAIRFNARVVRYPAEEVDRVEKEGLV